MSATLGFSSTVVKTTLYGPVRMRVAGAEGAQPFLALPGMGRSGNPDWERVIANGNLTGKANVRALLPDPLSNWHTAPSMTEFAIVRTVANFCGVGAGIPRPGVPCRESWLLQTLPEATSRGKKDENAHLARSTSGEGEGEGRGDGGGGVEEEEIARGGIVLAGHSWGGGAAARFAVAHPERVAKLVLVSPDVDAAVARELRVPTLLIWSVDDVVNPFFWTRRFRGHPSLTLHATEKGGHAVLESHADVIASWLNGDYQDDDGGNPAG